MAPAQESGENDSACCGFWELAIRLFSYVLRSDGGFSPNPFHGVCTLACCKPVIRRTARAGDLVVGLSTKSEGNRLRFAMVISECLPFESYWLDPRFLKKKPEQVSKNRVLQVGDNCYEPIEPGSFRQHPSVHSQKDGSEDIRLKSWDLSGQKVLIGDRFWYFGREALTLPEGLRFLIIGRGHRSTFTAEQIRATQQWIESLDQGLHGIPTLWPSGDRSIERQLGGNRTPRGCR